MREVFGMQEFMGLSDRDWLLMRTKWALINVIELMIEDYGLDDMTLAESAGEDIEEVRKWLSGIVRHATMDQLTVLHDAAAEAADLHTLEWIIRGPTDES